MTKKSKTVFVCSNCGEDLPKWYGRCPNCEEWGTVSEFRQSSAAGKTVHARQLGGDPATPVVLSSCKPQQLQRSDTGFPEVNRVLGSGLVPGSMVLVGGSPGIGKSTLVLQIAAHCTKNGGSVLYVSGEESLAQLSLRAQRLCIADVPISIITEICVERILESLQQLKPSVVIIDSVQTVFSDELESAPGSVSQVRECAALLMRYAKQTSTAMFLIGHVTKEGAIAGPRVLEHMVDTVLYFEGDSSYHYRILRAVKNRFGPSGEIALLSMSNSGLSEVSNASEFFLMHRDEPQMGTAVAPVMEGSRILLIELQALVNPSHFGMPQRVASGINPKKLSLLVAVLERYTGITIGDHDIFFNIAGGLSVSEPAIDIAVAASIISSFRNRSIQKGLAFIGELGLGGEIRPVHNMAGRLKELSMMGFTHCIIPAPAKTNRESEKKHPIECITCKNISQIQERMFEN